MMRYGNATEAAVSGEPAGSGTPKDRVIWELVYASISSTTG